jgi:hypothetical protein
MPFGMPVDPHCPRCSTKDRHLTTVVKRNSETPGRASMIQSEVPLESASIGKRPKRYPFIGRVKATDMVSGMQLEGLTTDLGEGGCCVLTRKGPFSPGTRILLEITKNGVLLATNATVTYNLKDQVMGLCFEEMLSDQAAILVGWMKDVVNSRLTVP